ncbi:unnamed protein product [Parascedosporium putredinis]|uniref:Uncharacterized protein n=1 Tax=Parascedosporium putredinis TaxID=1442378 RepID=A0A9P1GUT1_9PEZI|nr:unnamed protein product [Parascedosporium putredinis]CAI7987738.1 unnamed protein product [Parascedosporium putredinis]
MSSARMGSLPSLRRQHLLAEFTGLKQACPEGVFVSLTPGDPSLWSGVMFVRKGPYTPTKPRPEVTSAGTTPDGRSTPAVGDTPGYMQTGGTGVATYDVLKYMLSAFDDEAVLDSDSRAATGVRRPGDWNWDGVWEDRVKKNITASLSEPVLYGGGNGIDDVIGFLPMEESEVETVKGNLMRTLGVTK